MSVITLYRMYQVVELTTPTGASQMNYPINRTDFTLARHVDNEVEFWIKNIDRKVVSLANAALTCHIIEISTDRVLLSRELKVVDAAKGLVRLFVAAEETAQMPLGSSRYSVVLTRPDAVQVLLYTDRDRRGVGTVEVVNGPLPPPVEPQRIGLADFLSRQGRLYSGALMGAASVHNISGQHSAVLHCRGFSGRVVVQGTLATQPSSQDSDWFDVAVRNLVTETSNLHIPFEGNLLYCRFAIEQRAGTIAMIEYRN